MARYASSESGIYEVYVRAFPDRGTTLHDSAYNADRLVATGNPYKGLLADLMQHGVQVELCGATAKAHGWGNADLLPRIKINTDAMARMTQLVQQGFVKISES